MIHSGPVGSPVGPRRWGSVRGVRFEKIKQSWDSPKVHLFKMAAHPLQGEEYYFRWSETLMYAQTGSCRGQ